MSPRDALWRMVAPFKPKGEILQGKVSLRAEDKNALYDMKASYEMIDPPLSLDAKATNEEMLTLQDKRKAQLAAEVESITAFGDGAQFRIEQKRNITIPLRLYFIVDVVSIGLGYVLAWFFSSVSNYIIYDRSIESLFNLDDPSRLIEVGLVSAGVLVWFLHTGHYRTRMPFWAEAQKIMMTMAFSMLMDGFFQFAAKQSISRLWLMSSWGFAAVLIVIFRYLARKVMRKKGIWQVPTLLVGSGKVADEAREGLASEPGLGYRIVMQIDNLPATLKKSGNTWRLLCDRYSADFVVIALDGHELAESEEAIAMLVREGIPFMVSPPMRNLPVLGMTPQYFFNSDVMLLTPSSNLEQFLPRITKRTMDIVLAGGALVALSPLFLVLAYLVKKDGGPVFYGDRRIGRNGQIFSCLKFRSMGMNADKVLADYLEKNPQIREEWNLYRKLKRPPRDVCRSLHETPQLGRSPTAHQCPDRRYELSRPPPDHGGRNARLQ